MTASPRDWAALGPRLDRWTPPQGTFDPAAAWSLRYVRHALIPDPSGAYGGGPAGSLALDVKPDANAVALRAAEAVQAGFTIMTTEAEVICAPDALLTPRTWTLKVGWKAGPLSGMATDGMPQTRTGRADGKGLVFQANKERRAPAPAQWTGFWNLFAALPRLPFDAKSVLTFDLFEDLELHKPTQRLAYVGQQAVALSGRTFDLHVFEQTGCGVLPWRWWLDGQHRVLLAAGGRRAYLLDSTPKGGVA